MSGPSRWQAPPTRWQRWSARHTTAIQVVCALGIVSVLVLTVLRLLHHAPIGPVLGGLCGCGGFIGGLVVAPTTRRYVDHWDAQHPPS